MICMRKKKGIAYDIEVILIYFQYTGIPLHGVARSQINIVMKDMRGFNAKIQRFSNITIPLVWLEYVSYSIMYWSVFS